MNSSNLPDQDETWLTAQIVRWGDTLVRFGAAYTGNLDLAQDAAQETFLRLLKWRAHHPDTELQPGWLFTVARHAAIDLLRKHEATRRSRFLSEISSLPPSDEVITRIEVRRVLSGLPKGDRECLILFYFADLSITEIADQIGVSPSTVKMRLKRARARFQHYWRGE